MLCAYASLGSANVVQYKVIDQLMRQLLQFFIAIAREGNIDMTVTVANVTVTHSDDWVLLFLGEPVCFLDEFPCLKNQIVVAILRQSHVELKCVAVSARSWCNTLTNRPYRMSLFIILRNHSILHTISKDWKLTVVWSETDSMKFSKRSALGSCSLTGPVDSTSTIKKNSCLAVKGYLNDLLLSRTRLTHVQSINSTARRMSPSYLRDYKRTF